MAGTASRETRVLLEGFGMGESPRWHEGRLWFSSWGTDEIVAVSPDGTPEVMGPGGGGAGWAVDWLPDGRLLVTGAELLVVHPDGSRERHADLREVAPHGVSEIVVDGRGNAYVDSLGFDFTEFEQVMAGGRAPGTIALVTPDGRARVVADGLAFPNGMVITPDGRTLVVAESFARRLTAFDIGDDGSLSGRHIWADVTGGRHLHGRGGGHLDERGGPGGGERVPSRRGGGRGARPDRPRPALLRVHARRGRRAHPVHGVPALVRPRAHGGARRGTHGTHRHRACRGAARGPALSQRALAAGPS